MTAPVDKRGSAAFPSFPRIEGCPDDVCAATQLCLAAGECYADQYVEDSAWDDALDDWQGEP